jgi:hypothetical protein
MSELSELEVLKERATKIGIQFHPAIGVDKLRDKVNAALSEEEPEPEESPKEVMLTRKQRKDAASKLVRVRLTCMNPTKRDWTGEFFCVANTLIEHKVFVPFNADDGWHVPHMIYEMIRDRKCQVFFNKKVNGATVRVGKLIKEFGVELLPDLTSEELKELAAVQAANKSIEK